MELLELMSLPFMQRALLSGVALGLVLGVLGAFVTTRRMAFFGEGIAHATLAGVGIAVLTGLTPLPIALAWAVAMAITIFFLERSTRLPQDTLIGILFTSSLSLGIVLMSLAPGYRPELANYLFGSILSVTNIDVIVLLIGAVIILGWCILERRALTLLALNEDMAAVAGVNTKRVTLLVYIALAITMVLGVKMLGVVLISALLIIPAATGRILATSLSRYLVLTIIAGLLSTILGLILSALLNLPSGATIVLTSAVLFFFGLLWGKK